MKEPKKADKAYNEAIVNIEKRICEIQIMFNNMGGQVTDEECREMILLKHYSIINGEMHDYLDNERRKLISAFENLFDKYAVSAQQIDASRNEAMSKLTDALKALHYYD
jgi:type I restriction enzyme M protein